MPDGLDWDGDAAYGSTRIDAGGRQRAFLAGEATAQRVVQKELNRQLKDLLQVSVKPMYLCPGGRSTFVGSVLKSAYRKHVCPTRGDVWRPGVEQFCIKKHRGMRPCSKGLLWLLVFN